MRLPADCKTIDDVLRYLLSRLGPEDAHRLLAMLNDHDSEVAEIMMAIGRREMMLLIQYPSKN